MKTRRCFQILGVILLAGLLFYPAALADDYIESIGAMSGTCGENLSWDINECGVLTISGTGSMTDYTGLYGTPWELKKGSIQTIVVSDGVTSIGQFAFMNCPNLIGITLANSVQVIGDYAFLGCSNLQAVTLPNGVRHVGNETFHNCSELADVVFPSTLETIGDRAFESCGKLGKIDLPNSVTLIGARAFSHIDNLSIITLSTGLTELPGSILETSTNLEEISILEGITTIGSNAFAGSENLKTVYLPSTIKSIGSYAFYYCNALEDVYYTGTKEEAEKILIGSGNTMLARAKWHCTENNYAGIGATSGTCGENLTWILNENGTLSISGTGAMTDYTGSSGTPWELKKESIRTIVVNNGVTTVGQFAFMDCSNLISISLANSVQAIGDCAFFGCSSLPSVTLLSGMRYIGKEAFYNCSELEDVVFPSTVETIGDKAFESCNKLEEIKLPNSVTSIGARAFSHIENLSSITLSTGLTELPSSILETCTNLEEITIPEGITTIGANAFVGSENLKTVYLPSTIVNIGSYAFAYCNALENVYYDGSKEDAEQILIGSGNTTLAGAEWHCNTNSYAGIGATSGTCGENLTWILNENGTLSINGTGAMTDYTGTSGTPWELKKESIRTIVVNNGVTTVGQFAFMDCSNLISISLANSVQAIGDCAFFGCSSLPSVTLLSGMRYIGKEAFYNCSELEDVVFPSTVETIGDKAFESCNKLEEIKLPNSVTSIGTRAFSHIENLSSITLSTELTELPSSILETCSNLGEITIPEGVLMIGQNAFTGSENLKIVHLPSTIDNIGSYAFAYCNVLEDVYYAGTKEEAEQILIGMGNDKLAEVTWHCIQEHSWTVVYKWSYDNQEVTATRTCLLHPEETETETVSAKGVVTVSPTLEEAGEYSSISNEFTNPAFEVQSTMITIIPALKDMNTLWLPADLTVIEREAFAGVDCEAIIIPDGCTTIQSLAFANCEKLKYIFIPKTVTQIEQDICSGCPGVIVDLQ